MYIMTDSRDFRGEIAFQLCEIQSFENCMFFYSYSKHGLDVSCLITPRQSHFAISTGIKEGRVFPRAAEETSFHRLAQCGPSGQAKQMGKSGTTQLPQQIFQQMNMNISGQNCKNRDFQNSPPILPCWDFTVKPFAPLLRYPFPQDLGTIHHHISSSHQFCRWLYQLHSFRIASQWVLFDCLSTQMTDSLGKPQKKKNSSKFRFIHSAPARPKRSTKG